MNIGYIDGRRFKRALIAGGERLAEYTDQLNKVNVFPVPDSDTGSNMAGTFAAAIHGVGTVQDRSLAVAARAAAESALMGARGNSGAILAQFFYGVADQVKDDMAITSQRFADAVHSAVRYAYEAITTPKEGTILTVIKQWGESFREAHQRTEDFQEAFNESLQSAKRALEETRNTLPEMRKAGVVDAGALGFVHIIEGIYQFVTGGSIRDIDALPASMAGALTGTIEEPALSFQDGELSFRYCTECIVEGQELPLAEIRGKLAEMGDSLIVAGSATTARVHIHTDTPEEVFTYLSGFGAVVEPKADDMKKQFHTAHQAHGEVAIVVDSACDIPADLAEKPYLMVAPLRVTFGNESYVDKIGLSPGHFYQLLQENPDVLPKTSQPTAYEFGKQYRALLPHYKHVITVTIAGALSGTINAARAGIPSTNPRNATNAAGTASAASTAGTEAKADQASVAERIEVIDSRAVSVATGLIVRRLCEAVEAGASAREITELGHSLVERVRLIVAVPTMDFLIKGGRLSPRIGRLIGRLGLVALIKLNRAGEAKPFSAALTMKGGVRRLIRRAIRKLPSNAPADFAIAHVRNRETAEHIRERLSEHVRPRAEAFVLDAAPVLATHTGFGTVAIAYIAPE